MKTLDYLIYFFVAAMIVWFGYQYIDGKIDRAESQVEEKAEMTQVWCLRMGDVGYPCFHLNGVYLECNWDLNCDNAK